MSKSDTVENTSEETFIDRAGTVCPEHENPDEVKYPYHSATYTIPSDPDVAIRAECAECGEFMGEWTSEEDIPTEYEDMSVGVCPDCGDVAVDHYGAGRTVDGNVWHESCWYKTKYDGFEDTDGDAPPSRNSKAPHNLHRTVETEIDGVVYEWDEYLHTGIHEDYAKHNLPTRDELTPSQLETLREWATEENPTDDGKAHERDFSVGVFPADHVLLGGYAVDAPEKWICPDCGEIVAPVKAMPGSPPNGMLWPAADLGFDLQAECDNCGSDRWLTAGKHLEESAQDAFATLSDRERQVIMLDIVGHTTDQGIADTLDVQPSTVREYRTRAKEKAKSGKRLYDKMDAFDVV